MQLMFIILNKKEHVDTLIEELALNDIRGATIIESKGMAHSLIEHDEFRFVASLRSILDPARADNKTILIVLKDHMVSIVADIVNNLTGGISKPDTGIMFTVPINYCEGIIE